MTVIEQALLAVLILGFVLVGASFFPVYRLMRKILLSIHLIYSDLEVIKRVMANIKVITEEKGFVEEDFH